MDNAHTTTQSGGSLSVAVDRLDRALQALEARVHGLKNGETYEPDAYSAAPAADVSDGEYQSLLAELAEVRLREQQLAQAANDAYEALGTAAAQVRALLGSEAA